MSIIRASLISLFLLVVTACSASKINAIKNAENIEGTKSWGIVISPINVLAGNGKDEIVLWHSKYIKTLYGSEQACQRAAIAYENKNPPSYNMEIKCISPHPTLSPIVSMSADGLLDQDD